MSVWYVQKKPQNMVRSPFICYFICYLKQMVNVNPVLYLIDNYQVTLAGTQHVGYGYFLSRSSQDICTPVLSVLQGSKPHCNATASSSWHRGSSFPCRRTPVILGLPFQHRSPACFPHKLNLVWMCQSSDLTCCSGKASSSPVFTTDS